MLTSRTVASRMPARRVAPVEQTAMVRSSRAPPRRAAAPRRSTALSAVSRKASSAAGSLRGRGAYSYDNPGPWGKYGRAVGSLVGGKYAGPLGAALGGKLGSYAHYIGKIFGSGDYVTNSDRVKYNVLVNESQIPQFGSDPNVVHIRHREFLGDIVSSGSANTFNIQTFSINPGLAATFPWLSQVVGSTFQQYRINGMVFEYRTMSADALNSTNTALGSVVMATDYDSADAVFVNKQQMENTEFGVSCKPSCNMIHAIECARGQTSVSEQYIRSAAVPSGADIRLYDLGKFSIATTGVQGTSVNLGELWVSYDITVFKAIQSIPGSLILSAHYPLVVANLATQPVSLGTALFDNIGLASSNGLALTFPASLPVNSIWLIVLTQVSTAGGAAAATSLAFPTGTNGFNSINTFQNQTAAQESSPNPSPGPATLRLVQQAITVKNSGNTSGAQPTLTWAAPTTPFGAYQFGDLFVTMLNGGLTS